MSNGTCHEIDTKPAVAQVSVLLLKTKSAPVDTYEEFFAKHGNYTPRFIPVLEHYFKKDSLSWLQSTLENGGFAHSAVGTSRQAKLPTRYGGLIFTSQRAVEAFTASVQSLKEDAKKSLLPATLPLYVVGPATGRGLRSLNLQCPILGDGTGNGEALAAFMLQHYNSLNWNQNLTAATKLPLLFLVGEQRRDIIPKTLQSRDLSEDHQIAVVEVPVYETGEMQSFQSDFAQVLKEPEHHGQVERWIVVFSPTGCKAMLECLHWLDEGTGRFDPTKAVEQTSSTFVATIGPTTRDFLVKEFGFEPHVSAAKPSPEGIYSAINDYRRARSRG